MYFEFEVTNNSEVDDSEVVDLKINEYSNRKQDVKSTLYVGMSPPLPTSPLTGRRSQLSSNLSLSFSPNSSFTNHSSTPASKPLSPLVQSSASPISHQRYRRYSIHSGSTPFTLDTLHDNDNVSFCDLALITKKKLMQLNSIVKPLVEETIDPDLNHPVKLNHNSSNSKPNNKDLRREVLLASMNRSLSISSEDISLSKSPVESISKVTEKNETEDLPMEIASGGAKMLFSNNKSSIIQLPCPISPDEIMSDCYGGASYEIKRSHCSRIKARRSLSASNYTPIENLNNCMNSSTTSTSTTSMAGNKTAINHYRSIIKKLNGNSNQPPLQVNGSNNQGINNYYYSNSQNIALTITSSLITPKRIHSSSPSKYSSPYHTTSSSISKDFNLIFANASSPLSPECEWAFKRLKVMHGNSESKMDQNGHNSLVSTENPNLIMNSDLSLSHFPSANLPPENELNELAQDFHRLKTPFT